MLRMHLHRSNVALVTRTSLVAVALLCSALAANHRSALADSEGQCFEACPALPLLGCVAPSKRGALVIKDRSPDKRDVVRFVWQGDLDSADVGTPETTTGYTLCLYDLGSGAPPKSVSATPEDSTCGRGASRSCWSAKSSGGFRYKDKFHTWGGVQQLELKPGTGGRGSIKLKAKGRTISETDTLPDVLPLPTPFGGVTAQVFRNDDETKCWEAVFPELSFRKNDGEQLKAKVP